MFIRTVFLSVTFCLMTCVLPAAGQSQIVIENAFPNITFEHPVAFKNHGTDRVYIVQQGGKILTLLNHPSATDPQLFLDLSERLGETTVHAGLLGMAFHPNYAENGYFYVYYTTDHPMTTGVDTLHSVLSRFERSESDPTKADPTSELILLEIPKPTISHNGGGMAFGPKGYLYLALGEGSNGGDAFHHAQNRKTLLGSIIRIDVDHPSDGRNYGIPPGNPYVGNTKGYREEIFAYGFRNPWRLSVDPVTGNVWVGDVGERTWEEVNLVKKGGNYGWPIMEGPECFRAEKCDKSGLTLPVHAYRHSVGRCITGGYVYRGSAFPDLYGKYIFGDWASTKIWALEYRKGKEPIITDMPKGKHNVAFGVDKNNELYVVGYFHGKIWRFVKKQESSQKPEKPDSNAKTRFEITGPNPSSNGTTFTFEVANTGPVQIVVYDMLGRRVAVLFDGVVAGNSPRQVSLPAGRLPAGTYLFRMQTPGFAQTRKVLLVR